ncbi:MAG TPA: methyltransferase domain-containing protein [Acidimicrobiia bacterium]
MLDEDMQRVVREQRLGYVASVCPDGTPNLSPKGTTAVWDDEHLVFAHLHSPQTVANIEAGNHVVEINVVDPIVRKGYRFKGPATVHRAGAVYESGLRFYEERSGLGAQRVEAIVLVRVEQAVPLISPAYDDGSTEADIEQRSLELYGLMRTHRRSSRGWLLDEVAGAGRENLDVDHASRYDAKEDADAIGELALLGNLGLDERSEVVDIGAGTGQFVVAAASVCARVVAVDVSLVMLDQLTAKIGASGLSNVEVVRSGFLTYEHRGSPADFVYSRYVLHHLPDSWKTVALERVHRMVRPGGVLRLWDVVYSFDPAEADERIDAWCATGGSDAEQGWSRAELEEHVRDEHSTFTWLLEPMIRRCGFEIEAAEYSPDGCVAKYVARAV